MTKMIENHMYKVYYHGWVASWRLTNRTDAINPMTRMRKADWFAELEKDILENGVKNPIMAVAGYDLYNRHFAPGETFVDNYGGSRLWIAQQHELRVPMIVSTYDDSWDNGIEITEKEQCLQYFTEKPREFDFYSHQFYWYY